MAARIGYLVLASLSLIHVACTTPFEFTNGPVPNPFQLNQHYPDRAEAVECRPIRLRIERHSRRYRTDLVTNEHTGMNFSHSDARIMSSRLQRRLNELADLFFANYHVWITVTKAWTEYGDADVNDPNSLHFEGRREIMFFIAVKLDRVEIIFTRTYWQQAKCSQVYLNN